ncbi:hypothetical protein Tco_1252122 [Tanacetum coccineum]
MSIGVLWIGNGLQGSEVWSTSFVKGLLHRRIFSIVGMDVHVTVIGSCHMSWCHVWICQKSQEISQKRTRERMSDQEAKEIMPQPSTVNCS